MAAIAVTHRHTAEHQNNHEHRDHILRAEQRAAKGPPDDINKDNTDFDQQAEGTDIGGQANQPVRQFSQAQQQASVALHRCQRVRTIDRGDVVIAHGGYCLGKSGGIFGTQINDGNAIGSARFFHRGDSLLAPGFLGTLGQADAAGGIHGRFFFI